MNGGVFPFAVEFVLANGLNVSLSEVMTLVFQSVLAALGLGVVLLIFVCWGLVVGIGEWGKGWLLAQINCNDIHGMFINIVLGIFSQLIQLQQTAHLTKSFGNEKPQRNQVMDTDKGYYNILRSGKDVSHIQKKVKTFRSIFADKTQWSIHSGKWSRLEAHHSFASSHQMHVKSLQLYGNKQHTIIQCIVYPQFINLKYLNLKNNKITTIHSLSKLNASLLQQLHLGDNFITHIKQLTKLNCPNLSLINLYANRIVQINTLFMTNFAMLQVIILGLNCISSFQWLNKCQWKGVSKISIENNRKVKGGVNYLQKWKDRSQIVYG